MARLRNAFIQALATHNISQLEFSKRANVTHSAVSKFIQGTRPRDDFFRAIFASWPDQKTKRHLLRSHIADEIERAGLKPSDYDTALAVIDNTLERDLFVIECAMKKEPTLRDFISKIAATIPTPSWLPPFPYGENTADHQSGESLPYLAEEQGNYAAGALAQSAAKTLRTIHSKKTQKKAGNNPQPPAAHRTHSARK